MIMSAESEQQQIVRRLTDKVVDHLVPIGPELDRTGTSLLVFVMSPDGHNVSTGAYYKRMRGNEHCPAIEVIAEILCQIAEGKYSLYDGGRVLVHENSRAEVQLEQ